MSTQIVEAEEEEKKREQAAAHVSRWWFFRRSPKFLDAIFQLADPALERVRPYIQKGQVVADLGCGWGYYAFKLADLVGSEGKVYAVDLAENVIQSIQRKIDKTGRCNIEVRVTSAARLDFIQDRSVDFVFANGLLCAMQVGRLSAVEEMKRILKWSGKAYITGGGPPLGYGDRLEWENIMQGFVVERGGSYKECWALVSLIQ